MMKPVGGKIISAQANTELITWQSCGYTQQVDVIRLSGFYIKNEDVKDIFIKINGSDELLLKQGETYDFSQLMKVGSCMVTSDALVRWAGLIY